MSDAPTLDSDGPPVLGPSPTDGRPSDPLAPMRTKGYALLLLFAAAIGIPISLAAFAFLQALDVLTDAAYDDLPRSLGYESAPMWWPLPLLALAGVLVAFAVQRLPGRGGHDPADGFTAGLPSPSALPGVLLAGLASLALGAVLGPEAPLLALGGGLGALAIRLARVDGPPAVALVAAAAGSFAALAAIFGSPLIAAFFLMEAIGIGGAALSMVLLPGLVAAGVGYVTFIGFGHWTGISPPTLGVPHLDPYPRPTLGAFAWSVGLGLAGAGLGWLIRRLGVATRDVVWKKPFLFAPAAGLVVAGLGIAFGELSDQGFEVALFSGEESLQPLIGGSAGWTVGALVLLVLFKSLAYGVSLGGFRGGPTFPALLIGAAAGIALANVPGLEQTPAVAICMAAMCAAMLRLPLSSVVLVVMLTFEAGAGVTPLVIVAVVASYVASVWLPDVPARDPTPAAPVVAPTT